MRVGLPIILALCTACLVSFAAAQVCHIAATDLTFLSTSFSGQGLQCYSMLMMTCRPVHAHTCMAPYPYPELIRSVALCQ